MPIPLQVKLLRVLQEREVEPVGGDRPVPVDIRVVAATRRNLEQMVVEGSFREDLYYRLNVIRIALPPLREQVEDYERKVLREILERCDYNYTRAAEAAGIHRSLLYKKMAKYRMKDHEKEKEGRP